MGRWLSSILALVCVALLLTCGTGGAAVGIWSEYAYDRTMARDQATQNRPVHSPRPTLTAHMICSDFDSQEHAQWFYARDQSDALYLDRDKDGLACEDFFERFTTSTAYPTPTLVFANHSADPLPLDVICATRRSPLCSTPTP